METQVPWWVAAVSALAGSFVMPLFDRMHSWFKSRDDKELALAKIDDEKDQAFMAFLQGELARSREAEQACQENYHAAMGEIRKLSARCAKLEAIVVHLHPEVADELLKERE